ncbi:hypothetical protein [Aquimarina aggregata]|uniref:hypothetical protein n=1 Tax=Aquimarina aggregata TaxID=1642818 RepID=UPI002490AACD|nr:hypothetical protein [Aquimarina aggregata]
MKKEILNKLKEKIFSVLLKKTEMNELESWLYNEENIINSIENDSFIYDLITINYKDENAISLLEEIVFKKIKHEEYIILVIERNCENILDLCEWNSIYKLFNEIFGFFDYDKDYFLMWRFYSINSRIDLIHIGYESKTSITNEIKELSLQILSKLKECNTSDERIKILTDGFENSHLKEDTVKKEPSIKEGSYNKGYEFWK